METKKDILLTEIILKKIRHKIKSSLKNIFLQKDISIHIGIEKYNVKKMSGDVLTWVDLGTDLIRQRIDAKKIKYDKKVNFGNYQITR